MQVYQQVKISCSPHLITVKHLGRSDIYDNEPVTQLRLKLSNVHQVPRGHQVQAIC